MSKYVIVISILFLFLNGCSDDKLSEKTEIGSSDQKKNALIYGKSRYERRM